MSDVAARSSPVGLAGGVASMVTLSGDDGADMLPAESVSVAVSDQVPSESAGRSHEGAGSTYEHETETAPFVAVTVMVSPDEPPGADTVGVASFVTLSVFDGPVSEDAAMSGVDGADGAVVSSSSDNGDDDGETLPARSVNEPTTDHGPGVNVGRSQEVAEPTV